MEEFRFVLDCAYFYLPVYTANVLPLLAKRFKVLPALALPVDCNLKFHNTPLLGPNKTARGFILGTGGAMLVAWLQNLLAPLFPFPAIGLINYLEANPLLVGFLLGFGSLVGDSTGSFIKRRLGKKPGASFFILDQLGMAGGAALLVLWLYPVAFLATLTLVALTFVWHITASQTAYMLKLRESRW